MKKALSAFMALIVAIAMIPFYVAAEESTGGYQYVDYNDGVRIYNYTGDDSVLSIPAYIDGKKVLKINTRAFGAESTTQNITSVTVPDTVEEIEGAAFAGRKNLTDIYFPDSVTFLGSQMLAQCTSLTSVRLPKGLKAIYQEFFFQCSSLTYVALPESLTKIYGMAFSGCTSLEEIEIPDSVKYIEPDCFEDCTSLKTVIMPESLQILSPGTFKNCTGLTKVVLHKGIKTAYFDAFEGCTSLTDIYFIGTEEEFAAIDQMVDTSYLGDVTIHFVDEIPCFHVMETIPAKAATTTSTGNNKYYHCINCGRYYKDADGNTETTVKDETIAKKSKKTNPLKVKAKTVTVKYKTVKKKAVSIKRSSALTVTGAKGKVTYKKVSGPKKISVSKSGTIKLAKGTAKGTHKVKIKVSAAGTTTYKSGSKTVTVKIKVK